MSTRSRIEWTEHTWNPVVGCTKVSAGCKHCYAETMARRLQAMGAPGIDAQSEKDIHTEMIGRADSNTVLAAKLKELRANAKLKTATAPGNLGLDWKSASVGRGGAAAKRVGN